MPPRKRSPLEWVKLTVGLLEWVKLTVGLLAAAYAVAFVVLNATNRSNVWLMGLEPRNVPTLVVIVLTAVLTLIVAWLVRHGLHRWVWRRGPRR